MSIEQSQLSNLVSASTLNLTELLNESKAVLDEESEDRCYSIWVSCAEIYNEFVYDLIDDVQLEEQSKVKDKKKKMKRTVLKLAHDKNKNCYVKGMFFCTLWVCASFISILQPPFFIVHIIFCNKFI